MGLRRNNNREGTQVSSNIKTLMDLLASLEAGGAKVHAFGLNGDDPECNHAECNTTLLTADDVASIEAPHALALAIAAAAGASNRISAGSGTPQSVHLVQEQSRIWLDIHERLRSEEERASMRADFEEQRRIHEATEAANRADASERDPEPEPEPKTSNGVPFS